MSQTYTFILPDIGEGNHEGEVVSWLKQVGDKIEENQPIVVILTDKAAVELPSPYAGTLIKQHYHAGQLAITGNPLYDLEISSDIALKFQQDKTPARSLHVQNVYLQETFPSKDKLALPSSRQLAKKLGIDLNLISGTGREGRVTEKDIEKFHLEQTSRSTQQHLPGDERFPITGIKHQMFRKMSESHQMIPQFSYFEQIDAAPLIQLRQAFNQKCAKGEQTITFMPYLIRALSLTILQYPILNSSVDVKNNQLIMHKQHNIGIAAKIASGLIVPVLKNIQDFSFEELLKNYQRLIDQIRVNEFQPADMKNGTITITNYGKFGNGLWATPIINYPEVAILAIAKIQKQPFVRNEQLVATEVLNVSWSFDHRVIDGEDAALISNYFSKLIQNPYQLLS